MVKDQRSDWIGCDEHWRYATGEASIGHRDKIQLAATGINNRSAAGRHQVRDVDIDQVVTGGVSIGPIRKNGVYPLS